MKLGAALRHLMGDKGWSLWALAKRGGVTTANVGGSCGKDRPATDPTQQPLNCRV
jgi:hypothetical protein